MADVSVRCARGPSFVVAAKFHAMAIRCSRTATAASPRTVLVSARYHFDLPSNPYKCLVLFRGKHICFIRRFQIKVWLVFKRPQF